MAPLAFISYRRTDSQQAALGLFAQLRARLGSDCVFMDRSGISAGDSWPERLRERINQSTVVLALIGPGWLTAADSFGRRRLDLPNDWVRNELTAALDSGKAAIPILIGSVLSMPPPEALPHELTRLCEFEQFGLRDERWDADLNGLIDLLVERYGFKDAEVSVRLPDPQIRLQPLTEGEYAERSENSGDGSKLRASSLVTIRNLGASFGRCMPSSRFLRQFDSCRRRLTRSRNSSTIPGGKTSGVPSLSISPHGISDFGSPS